MNWADLWKSKLLQAEWLGQSQAGKGITADDPAASDRVWCRRRHCSLPSLTAAAGSLAITSCPPHLLLVRWPLRRQVFLLSPRKPWLNLPDSPRWVCGMLGYKTFATLSLNRSLMGHSKSHSRCQDGTRPFPAALIECHAQDNSLDKPFILAFRARGISPSL